MTCIDFGWSDDLATIASLFSIKGEQLFHTKNTLLFDDSSKENATAIALRLSADSPLLLYIGLSKSGRLTTLRLFYDYPPGEVTTIPAGTLRLLLTSISCRAKPEKRSGGSRQWFRPPAAGLLRRVECARQTRRALTADPVPDLQPLR